MKIGGALCLDVFTVAKMVGRYSEKFIYFSSINEEKLL